MPLVVANLGRELRVGYPIQLKDVEVLDDFEEKDDQFPDLEVEGDDWEYVEDEDDEIPFEDDETDDDEENEEDYSSPRDWLHSKYQNLPMEDAVFEVLKECQPAKPGDVALRMYKIREDDPNFRRVKNSVNAALTNGKNAGKWKAIRRGVYALNSFPDSFAQNGHYKSC